MISDDYHIPVMTDEVIRYLRVVRGGLYIDCTLGGGGHSRAILERGGTVIGIDRDPGAVGYATVRLTGYGDRFSAREARFSSLVDITGNHVGAVDGVLMDLGVSSKMIDDPSKGFSYRHDGPLLMTMGFNEETAFDVINTKNAHELSRIFSDYGEERRAGRIAEAVVKARASHPIKTTAELASIIEQAVGPRMPQKSKARVFQALRIYINDELNELREGLNGALELLKPGGRLCVISYHSLEDRLVKSFMREHADPCICPPDLPECRCGRIPDIRLVTRKSIEPSEEEIRRNPRSRSARMRVAEKAGVS
ncbi:16S rRNA (cytosine(1402)-N(4))-methyltransferase RsmH [bacterium]|nr:16S rRNA (cytosine(1402)-N(4))-methyltransferase RsmH [bacterium]